MYVRPLIHLFFTQSRAIQISIYSQKSPKNHLPSNSPNTQVFTTFTSYHILLPLFERNMLEFTWVLPNFVEPLHLAYHGLTPKYQTWHFVSTPSFLKRTIHSHSLSKCPSTPNVHPPWVYWPLSGDISVNSWIWMRKNCWPIVDLGGVGWGGLEQGGRFTTSEFFKRFCLILFVVDLNCNIYTTVTFLKKEQPFHPYFICILGDHVQSDAPFRLGERCSFISHYPLVVVIFLLIALH
jgi:hypothetical protein